MSGVGRLRLVFTKLKEVDLNARNKLNTAHIHGSLLLACIVGYFTGSWFVFAVVFAILIAGSLSSGGIRSGSRRR
jgi:hypothetical protein